MFFINFVGLRYKFPGMSYATYTKEVPSKEQLVSQRRKEKGRFEIFYNVFIKKEIKESFDKQSNGSGTDR